MAGTTQGLITYEKNIQAVWEALNDGESFFVPSIDPIRDKILCLELGYIGGKNPPEAQTGVYRGLHGVLCYRKKKHHLAK